MPKPFQGSRGLPQLFAICEAHGIDDQVRVNMFRVAVGCNKNLEAIVVFCQFQCCLVRLRRRDIFLRGETLRVMIEENALGLA